MGRGLGGRRAGALAALALLAGCPSYGIVDDGTSLSWGGTNGGSLLNPARLPVDGDGYYTPPRWDRRGLRYGTDELVTMLVHTGREMSARLPGRAFGVADLSTARGGPSAWHRSHQTGRDVDLLFLARDAEGRPVRLDRMPRFGAQGGVAGGDEVLHFDVEANWVLVRALLTNPVAEVQWIFISEPLKQLLLDHAMASGEPMAIVQYANAVLHQPGDSLPHNDHFHVRIYCPVGDRHAWCVDRAPLRWTKKAYKYRTRLADAGGVASIGEALLGPLPAMLALVFPFRGAG